MLESIQFNETCGPDKVFASLGFLLSCSQKPPKKLLAYLIDVLPEAFTPDEIAMMPSSSESLAPEIFQKEFAFELLCEHILFLLDRDLQAFATLLYQVDVAEHAVKNAFGAETPFAIAEEISTQILLRQRDKLLDRDKWSQFLPE